MQIDTMLPELCDKPFNNDGYIFEPKVDGLRLLVVRRKGIVRLLNSRGMDVTWQYPELCLVPVKDGADVVLDGVAAFFDDAAGGFSSDSLRERMRMRKTLDIRLASVSSPLRYFAFDILEYDGEDVRGLPLKRRKELLGQALDENRCYNRLFALEAEGMSLYDAIKGEGVEGIVAKRLDSRYEGRRDANWLTIRKYRYADVRIAGYRKHGFGWLLEWDGYRVGVVDAGVPGAHKEAFQFVAPMLVTGEDRDFVYVRPVIEARIRYLHRARSGEVRNPEFVRFVS